MWEQQREVVILAALALLPALAGGAEPSGEAFGRLLEPYDEIRLSLLRDSPDAARPAGKMLAERAGKWAERAGGEGHRPFLRSAAEAARLLAVAADLEASREAFGALSEELIRLRAALGVAEGVVVNCPMVDKAWLQPEGSEIGNPFSGSSMARCGVIVED